MRIGGPCLGFAGLLALGLGEPMIARTLDWNLSRSGCFTSGPVFSFRVWREGTTRSRRASGYEVVIEVMQRDGRPLGTRARPFQGESD